jgi:copper homeostasis protein
MESGAPVVERPLLEVIALGPDDAANAEEGGADRLEIVADMSADGLSPDVATVADIRRATALPVRVMLRAEEGFLTSTSELQRLARSADQYAGAGADGFVFGFLTPDASIDVDATAYLAESDAVAGRPWTFHRAIDNVLESRRAWSAMRDLPGMDAVLTAGSARGLSHGVDDLIRLAEADAWKAGLVMAGGGLQTEHVPWLMRSGVTKFHIGSSARPQGSWKAYVDSRFVRSWRRMLDAEFVRFRRPSA